MRDEYTDKNQNPCVQDQIETGDSFSEQRSDEFLNSDNNQDNPTKSYLDANLTNLKNCKQDWKSLFYEGLNVLILLIIFTWGYMFFFSGPSNTTVHTTGNTKNNPAFLKAYFKATTSDQENIWSRLTGTESRDKKNTWVAFDHQQNAIEKIKQSLSEDLGFDLESKLPDEILVQKNKGGGLELPLKVYAYLKDETAWNIYLEHNAKFIKMHMSAGKSQYHKKQPLEEVIVDREVFMELILNSLYSHHIKTHEQLLLPFDKRIETLVQKHYQAISNTPDFALEARGARVVMALTSETYYALPLSTRIVRRMLMLHDPFTAPQMAIMTNANFGECWTMLGNSGHLGIKLSETLVIQEITLEYPSHELMLNDMSTAPKSFSVYGIVDYRKSPKDRDFLGSFIYDIHARMPIQTFIIDADKVYTHVFIKFNSNWGNPDHTDIYRVRVHGTPARNW